MFLSTAAVLLLVVLFFDTIVLETPSVRWIRSQSRVFIQIFDYMDDPWLHGLNGTDLKRVGVSQSIV